LQNAIDRHIQANHAKITEEEAGKIFIIEWNKIESEM
jgi:DNA-directed RNA polymerase beta' subunit